MARNWHSRIIIMRHIHTNSALLRVLSLPAIVAILMACRADDADAHQGELDHAAIIDTSVDGVSTDAITDGESSCDPVPLSDTSRIEDPRTDEERVADAATDTESDLDSASDDCARDSLETDTVGGTDVPDAEMSALDAPVDVPDDEASPDVPVDVVFDTGDLDVCGNAPGQLFPPGAVWNTAVDTATLDLESAQIIAYLQANSAAGGTLFQIDWSNHRLEADGSTEHRSFTPSGAHYSPDCDTAPVPIPPGGAIEGETGYTCYGDGDCHILVRDLPECRLYEQWRVNLTPDGFDGGCLAIWDIGSVPPPMGRGQECTSADAAGLPILPLLFSSDEVAAGEIRHALRFILPNSNIRNLTYVHPATHSTSATGGPSTAPPYGARLRLRADFDMSVFADNPAAAVVARALQRYGMFLADGGRVTFTAQNDRFSSASWSDVGLDAHDLKVFQWTDFEVVNGGTRFNWTGDCIRTPITGD